MFLLFPQAKVYECGDARENNIQHAFIPTRTTSEMRQSTQFNFRSTKTMQEDQLLKVISEEKLPRSKYKPTVISALERFTIDLCIDPYRITPIYNDAKYDDMHDFHFLLASYLYHYARGLRWLMDNIYEIKDIVADMKRQFESCVDSISDVRAEPEEYSPQRMRKLTAQLQNFHPDVHLIYPRRIVQLLSPGQINSLTPKLEGLVAINEAIMITLIMMKSRQGQYVWSYGKDKKYLNPEQCLLSWKKSMEDKGRDDRTYFSYYFPPYSGNMRYLAHSFLWKRYQEKIIASMNNNKPLITRYILERKDVPGAVNWGPYLADLDGIYEQIRNIITGQRSIITLSLIHI